MYYVIFFPFHYDRLILINGYDKQHLNLYSIYFVVVVVEISLFFVIEYTCSFQQQNEKQQYEISLLQ